MFRKHYPSGVAAFHTGHVSPLRFHLPVSRLLYSQRIGDVYTTNRPKLYPVFTNRGCEDVMPLLATCMLVMSRLLSDESSDCYSSDSRVTGVERSHLVRYRFRGLVR